MTSVRSGLGIGFIGIFLFSFSVPLTRVALGGMSPVFVTSARAVVAGMLAIIFLAVARQSIPSRKQLFRLLAIGGGIVIGFSLFTSLAMLTVPASHAAVVVGLLPAATAVFAVVRGAEHPPKTFWVFAGLGASSVIAFAAISAGEFGTLELADLYLVAAVIVTAYGYSEGAVMAREIGSWQTISWAVITCLPLTIPATIWSLFTEPLTATPGEWWAFAYLAAVSMYLAFFAWYRGLAIGPVPTVSQVQLTQPVMSILWSAVLLGETITPEIVIGGSAVVVSALLAVRSRLVKRSAL